MTEDMNDQAKEPEVNWDELRPQLIRITLEIGPLLARQLLLMDSISCA